MSLSRYGGAVTGTPENAERARARGGDAVRAAGADLNRQDAKDAKRRVEASPPA